MIAFGAVIGRVTPTQLLWLMVLQVPVYAFNMHMVSESTYNAAAACCLLALVEPRAVLRRH
jgi:hypothetical protein